MIHVSSVAVFDKENRLLLGLRKDSWKWNLPGGHIEEGETPVVAAQRELYEEAGIKVAQKDLYPLGSETFTNQGKRITVNCFRVFLDRNARPTTKKDPDKECVCWKWVDVSEGLPPSMAKRLHNRRDVTLYFLNLQEKPLRKNEDKDLPETDQEIRELVDQGRPDEAAYRIQGFDYNDESLLPETLSYVIRSAAAADNPKLMAQVASFAANNEMSLPEEDIITLANAAPALPDLLVNTARIPGISYTAAVALLNAERSVSEANRPFVHSFFYNLLFNIAPETAERLWIEGKIDNSVYASKADSDTVQRLWDEGKININDLRGSVSVPRAVLDDMVEAVLWGHSKDPNQTWDSVRTASGILNNNSGTVDKDLYQKIIDTPLRSGILDTRANLSSDDILDLADRYPEHVGNLLLNKNVNQEVFDRVVDILDGRLSRGTADALIMSQYMNQNAFDKVASYLENYIATEGYDSKVDRFANHLVHSDFATPDFLKRMSQYDSDAKKLLAQTDPDSAHSERVSVKHNFGTKRFGPNALRKLRDHIESVGGRIHKKVLEQEGRHPGPALNPAQDGKGWITADSIQRVIDNLPGDDWNISHSQWRGPQRHSNVDSRVLQVNLTNDKVQRLKEAGVWKAFRSMIREMSGSHPVGPATVGWVRYTTTNPLDGIVDASETARKWGRVHSNEDRIKAIEDYRQEVDPNFAPHIDTKAFRQKIEEYKKAFDDVGKEIVNRMVHKATSQGDNVTPDARSTLEWYVNSQKEDFLRDLTSPLEYHRKAGRNKIKKWITETIGGIEPPEIPDFKDFFEDENEIYIDEIQSDFGPSSKRMWTQSGVVDPKAFDTISNILFEKRNPSEVLMETFQEYMRQKGKVGAKFAIPNPETKRAMVASFDHMDLDRPIPVHMKQTYSEIPTRMHLKESKYGTLGTQSNPKWKDQPTYEGTIRKKEEGFPE